MTSRIYHTVWDNTCAKKFPLVSMGGRAEGQACADPGARTPIGASGNFLLPIKERIHRLSPTTSPLCTQCNDNMIENLLHTFDSCSNNNGAGPALVAVLRDHMPTINMEKIMRLEFSDLEEDMEYPAVWFTAAFLFAIWEKRTKA